MGEDKRLLYVVPEFHIPSGTKKNMPSDLDLDDDALDGKVVTIGAKQIFPRELIAPLNRIKKAFERGIHHIGVHSAKGRLVAFANQAELQRLIDTSKTEWATAEAELRQTYEARLKAWLALNPTHATLIQGHMRTVEDVLGSVSCKIFVFPVLEISTDGEIFGDTSGEIKNIANRLFEEIATDAGEFAKRFLRKNRVKRNALRPIRRAREKLASLSVFDTRIAPVVEHIDEVLGNAQGTTISDRALAEVVDLVLLLQSAARMKIYGEQQSEPASSESATPPLTSIAAADPDETADASPRDEGGDQGCAVGASTRAEPKPRGTDTCPI